MRGLLSSLVLTLLLVVPAASQQSRTISPGMTLDEVVRIFGSPTFTFEDREWKYLFYSNPCRPRCVSDDVVFLHRGQVRSATFRSGLRAMADRPAEVAPPVVLAAQAEPVRPQSEEKKAASVQKEGYQSATPNGTAGQTPPVAAKSPSDTVRKVNNGKQQAPDVPAPRSLVAARISGSSPVLDGRINEPVWRQAKVVGGFVQHEPDAGRRATERTDVRVVYDHEAIYVGIRLHDSSPDSIAAQVGAHDEEVYSDWISVQLDSNHDRRTAYEFSANPVGTKADALIYDDTEMDTKWDAVWHVAARRDTAGWTAEFRIPFNQLRFDLPKDTTVATQWGINVRRYIARREEISDWAPVPRNANRFVSLFGTLEGLKGIEPPKRVEVRPYVATRLLRSPHEEGNPFWQRSDLISSTGADVKVGLTSGLTLTATINPEFGEVEADRSYVRNTGDWEPFFPEKRPFFLEGAEIFRFNAKGTHIFHSRRIGEEPREPRMVGNAFVDVPSTTPILGAAKLSGKTRGGWSIGLLSAVTSSVDAQILSPNGETTLQQVEPLTSFSVARVAKDLNDGNSTIGGIFTATNRSLDNTNLEPFRDAAYVGGVDFRHRFREHYELSGMLAGSRVEGSVTAIQRLQQMQGHTFQRPDAPHLEFDSTLTQLSGYSAGLDLSRFGGGRWGWQASLNARSPGFEVNDAGYQTEADVVSQSIYVRYERPQAGKLFRRWHLDFNQSSDWSFGAERLGTSIGVDGGFQFQNFWGGSWSAYRELSGFNVRALNGGPALLTPARTRASLSVYTDRRRRLSASIYGGGWLDEEGGQAASLGGSLRFRASDRLELSLDPYVSRYVNPAQLAARPVIQNGMDVDSVYVVGRNDQTTVSLTPRIRYSFTPRLSLQFYAMPFINATQHSEYKEVLDPRAPRRGDRFRAFSEREIAFDSVASRYKVDRDGDGLHDYFIWPGSYNFQEMRAQTVLTWEYRPGSTLFVVWRQDRTGMGRGDGALQLDRDAGRLLGLEHDSLAPTNVFILKLSYWMGLW